MTILAITIVGAFAAPFLLTMWAARVAHDRSDFEARNAALLFLVKLLMIAGIMIAMVMAVAFAAGVALAYPENSRHGYPACSICHVAPTGGGVLTGYGRSTAPAFMSTWAADGEERPGWGLVTLPDWLAVGGDTRTMGVAAGRADTREVLTSEYFLMQADAEIAVSPVEPVTFVASAGIYGRERELEYRRAYLKLSMVDGAIATRAGRFIPAYGILVPDHRTPTRAGLGLGQGGEVYAAELAVTLPVAEVIMTEVVGSDATLDMAAGGGYAISSDSRSGFMGRGAIFVGDRCQVGLSYMALTAGLHERQAVGAHVIAAASERVYLLAEYDRRFDDAVATDLAMARVGAEIFDGFHLVTIGQKDGETKGGGLGLQWFPRPHLEFASEWQRLFTPGAPAVDVGLIMAHHYL